MTHDKWHSHSQEVFHSVEMDEENVKNVGSFGLKWNRIYNPVFYNAVEKHYTQHWYCGDISWKGIIRPLLWCTGFKRHVNVPLYLCFRAPRLCEESECQLPGHRRVSDSFRYCSLLFSPSLSPFPRAILTHSPPAPLSLFFIIHPLLLPLPLPLPRSHSYKRCIILVV